MINHPKIERSVGHSHGTCPCGTPSHDVSRSPPPIGLRGSHYRATLVRKVSPVSDSPVAQHRGGKKWRETFPRTPTRKMHAHTTPRTSRTRVLLEITHGWSLTFVPKTLGRQPPHPAARSARTGRGRCPDGAHVLSRRDRNTSCRLCGISYQSLVDHFGDAAKGDYRVVCRQPGCDYGEKVDPDGNGYTNHASLAMAVAALQDHQDAVEPPSHRAQIEQHPIPLITDTT